jgi:hypothetical protein
MLLLVQKLAIPFESPHLVGAPSNIASVESDCWFKELVDFSWKSAIEGGEANGKLAGCARCSRRTGQFPVKS